MLMWYTEAVSGTWLATMGDRGRLVIPAALRERAGLREGDELVLLDCQNGIVLLTRDQLKSRVRADLAGTDLVEDLLEERRRTAKSEDER
jgi:AbrB family looped-hinge helix DNA binding protein